jgi:hypothetical protein
MADPDPDPDLAEVVRRELLLLEPEVRNDPARVLALVHPDFREHGASGRVWDAATVPGATAGTTERIRATGVRARRLGPDAVLVTYTSDAAGRRALRSSVWVREQGREWLLLFHQGTLTGP